MPQQTKYFENFMKSEKKIYPAIHACSVSKVLIYIWNSPKRLKREKNIKFEAEFIHLIYLFNEAKLNILCVYRSRGCKTRVNLKYKVVLGERERGRNF